MVARTFTRLSLLATLAVGSTTCEVFAQSQVFDVAPLQFVGQVRRASTDDFNQVVAGIHRAVPVAYLLPQVTPDSYFEVLRAIVGSRFTDHGERAFRFRATGLKFEIQKSPWAAGLTIADYDASGLDDMNADWLGLLVGSGFDFGSETNRIVIRALLGGSFNSHRFGEDVFPDLGERADNSRHGVAYRAGLHGGIFLENRLSLTARYDLGRHSSSKDLRRVILEADLAYRATDRLTFVGSFSFEEASLGKASGRRRAFGFGVRYNRGELLY